MRAGMEAVRGSTHSIAAAIAMRSAACRSQNYPAKPIGYVIAFLARISTDSVDILVGVPYVGCLPRVRGLQASMGASPICCSDPAEALACIPKAGIRLNRRRVARTQET